MSFFEHQKPQTFRAETPVNDGSQPVGGRVTRNQYSGNIVFPVCVVSDVKRKFHGTESMKGLMPEFHAVSGVTRRSPLAEGSLPQW